LVQIRRFGNVIPYLPTCWGEESIFIRGEKQREKKLSSEREKNKKKKRR